LPAQKHPRILPGKQVGQHAPPQHRPPRLQQRTLGGSRPHACRDRLIGQAAPLALAGGRVGRRDVVALLYVLVVPRRHRHTEILWWLRRCCRLHAAQPPWRRFQSGYGHGLVRSVRPQTWGQQVTASGLCLVQCVCWEWGKI